MQIPWWVNLGATLVLPRLPFGYAVCHSLGLFHGALTMLAVMRRQMFATHFVPAAGQSFDLREQMQALNLSGIPSYTRAMDTRSADGGTWTYDLAYGSVTLLLSHTETSRSAYSGTLQMLVQIGSGGVGSTTNCPNITSRSTAATLKYQHSSTATIISHRAGTFCGNPGNLPSNVFLSDGQLNPAAKFNVGTGKGWADGFPRYAANHDPGWCAATLLMHGSSARTMAIAVR